MNVPASPWWLLAVTAMVFACGTYLTLQFAAYLCKDIVPFEDGPRAGKPPVLSLVAGSFAVGVVFATRSSNVALLAIELLLVAALAAAWYSDVRCGIVPDYFTLVPLGIFLGVAVLTHQFGPLISAAIVFVPFAAAAFLSKGRGMGWGDVKLATLGAAVLPLEAAIIAFAAACFVAVGVAVVRNRRSEPIAFAPYLACAIALGMAVPLFT